MTTLHEVLTHMHAGRWNEAHRLVQELPDDPSHLGAWLHGILHVQEGDLEDAEYWYGQAGLNFRSRGNLDEELERFEAMLPRT
jgi:hypothetical protein